MTMNASTTGLLTRWVTICAMLFIAAGCAATKQARKTETSGFLGDYSKLKTGGETENGDRALLYYFNPEAQWAKYDKILMNPVRVYASKESKINDLDREKLQALVDYFDASVRTSLATDYTFVDKPAADAIRLRIALTDAEGSKIVLDTMSNILPPALVIGALKTAFTGSSTGVGAAGVEVELQDSVTGERLAAMVDRRVGTKTFEGKFDKWDDVKEAIDYWSQRLKERLADKRAGRD